VREETGCNSWVTRNPASATNGCTDITDCASQGDCWEVLTACGPAGAEPVLAYYHAAPVIDQPPVIIPPIIGATGNFDPINYTNELIDATNSMEVNQPAGLQITITEDGIYEFTSTLAFEHCVNFLSGGAGMNIQYRIEVNGVSAEEAGIISTTAVCPATQITDNTQLQWTGLLQAGDVVSVSADWTANEVNGGQAAVVGNNLTRLIGIKIADA